jgi:FKBP-type peptidyl-prolyl cis-trans isomerase
MYCIRRGLAAAVGAALAIFCAVAAPAQQATPAKPAGPPPISSVVQWNETPSGLKYAELVIGKGASPKDGLIAVVHFTGWLADGTQFDSSRTRKPFGFKLGSGQVIRGWDEGVRGMKIGGKRRLIIPGTLGYGQRGVPGMIPPDATLTFDIELLAVVDESKQPAPKAPPAQPK